MSSYINKTPLAMNPNDSPFCITSQEGFRQLKNKLREGLVQTPQLQDYIQSLQNEIQLKQDKLSAERMGTQKGRGGNSMAENVKKTFLSLLPKHISPVLFAYFQEECVKKYNLRSQKQNIIVFFLFLSHLAIQGKITNDVIRNMKYAIDEKINKYIANSREKIELEPHRKEFHLKNITQFEKFIHLRVEFEEGSSFNELAHQLSTLFLRKKVSCNQALLKLRSIISSLPTLRHYFCDFGASEAEDAPSSTGLVKQEEVDSGEMEEEVDEERLTVKKECVSE